VKFFLDNCLSPRYARALLGHGWMNLQYWPQAVLLVRWWPNILEQARLVERGTGFEVPYRAPGRFKAIIVRP